MRVTWDFYNIFATFLKSKIVPQYKIKYTFLFIFSCKCHVNTALIKGKVNENKTKLVWKQESAPIRQPELLIANPKYWQLQTNQVGKFKRPQ